MTRLQNLTCASRTLEKGQCFSVDYCLTREVQMLQSLYLPSVDVGSQEPYCICK